MATRTQIRTQLLKDPKSGARPLFSQDAHRFIAAANKTQSLAEPDPQPKPKPVKLPPVDSNWRTQLCQFARTAAYEGDFPQAREIFAKAKAMERGWSHVVRFTGLYVEEAATGEQWTKDAKWTTWHLPSSMHGVPERVRDASSERVWDPQRGLIDNRGGQS